MRTLPWLLLGAAAFAMFATSSKHSAGEVGDRIMILLCVGALVAAIMSRGKEV